MREQGELSDADLNGVAGGAGSAAATRGDVTSAGQTLSTVAVDVAAIGDVPVKIAAGGGKTLDPVLAQVTGTPVAADLTTANKSLSAIAKVISVSNSNMDTVINLIR